MCSTSKEEEKEKAIGEKEGRKEGRLARKRFVVERAISKVKKFNIMGTRFRNRLKRYNHVFDIVSGLVNFRIMRSKGMML